MRSEFHRSPLVSIPKRVLEALNRRIAGASSTIARSSVSIPKRVLEALNLNKLCCFDHVVVSGFNP